MRITRSTDLFTNQLKVFFTAACFSAAVIGFMIKLPVPLRGIDQELHALFFFFAAAFLNVLFQNRSIANHLLIFGMLFLFSALIEFAQEYSNVLFNKRIHGRFDPEDLKFNLLGMFSFSVLWFAYFIVNRTFSKNQDEIIEAK